MVGVEQWAEIRRLHFVRRLSLREIHRRTGLHRDTIRRALASEVPPRYSRGRRGSKLDPFKDEIDRLLGGIRRCRACGSASCSSRWAGTAARRSWMTTCARSGRCLRRGQDDAAHDLSARARSASSTSGSHARDPGRPRPDAPGLCRGRVPGLLARRRRARWSSASRLRICWPGSAAACGSWAGCPRRWSGIARPASTPTTGGPTRGVRRVLRAAAGRLAFLRPRDPQAKGVVERLQGYAETNFEPGRVFANELDFQDQFDALVREGQRAPAPHDPGAADRPPRRGAGGDGRRCRRSRRTPIGAGCCASRRTPTFASTAATTRSIRISSAAASRSASATASSPRPRWTPASWPAGTRGRSRRHRTITALEHARALKRRRGATPNGNRRSDAVAGRL